jgi:hypothetical protein
MFACCMCHIKTGVRLSTIVLVTGAAAASALLLMMGASRSSIEMSGNRMLAREFLLLQNPGIINKPQCSCFLYLCPHRVLVVALGPHRRR